jgi:peptide/nickel transport system ATP-binding protein
MLLAIEKLSIDLPTPDGPRRILRDVSFTLDRGETLGVVGESGSGKTMTSLALMGLLPEGARIAGTIQFDDRNLAALGEDDWSALRGDRIAMIFQEPMTALNPLQRIGDQIAEPLRLHRGLSRNAAFDEATKLLERVGLPDPVRRARAYPHELSGGQRQRAMIAMALSCGPQLVIADEPTTALDVTVQAQILDLLAGLREETGMALILVSHDLAIIAETCARVLVMYGGTAMESGPTREVLAKPAHPYTRALLEARPQLGAARSGRLRTIPGSAPAAGSAPPGCAFAGRCPFTIDACASTPPPPLSVGEDHFARCIRLNEPELAA